MTKSFFLFLILPPVQRHGGNGESTSHAWQHTGILRRAFPSHSVQRDQTLFFLGDPCHEETPLSWPLHVLLGFLPPGFFLLSKRKSFGSLLRDHQSFSTKKHPMILIGLLRSKRFFAAARRMLECFLKKGNFQ
ncbi:MAG: hypothetical protein ONB48_10960 [candidate division KSB1 bacterium]|nr:hypothetical protein [candidate division KSB1 bacterium]MDZ7275526.1 hypothetical protein [candidate division KSB1 bacterium]MDZ7286162.1 hypothetical protein [candidate division KSB1 bacterium]MDZ7296388.1 hypothetical protein [candidate division KSB1 bacterium]MDZ7306223.1 hypothetical protein [candidate division KSB1 bacterium]